MNMAGGTMANLVASAYQTQVLAGHVDVDDVVRRGDRRRRRRSLAGGAILTAGATAGIVTVAVVGSTALAGYGQADPASDSSLADVGLAVLESPQGPGDRLFEDVVDTDVVGQDSILPSSTRFLAELDGIEYYAGVSPQGDVCVAEDGPVGIGGSSCEPQAAFRAHGVWIGHGPEPEKEVLNPAEEHEIVAVALLLPDGVIATGVEADELVKQAGVPIEGTITVLTPNLLVVTPQEL